MIFVENNISISYALLACKEVDELKQVLSILHLVKRPIDEIVVLLDKDNYDKTILSYIYNYADVVEFNALDNNFGNQKNKLISLCSKEYILNLDADEYISAKQLKLIPTILEQNYDVELFVFPRINIVHGITIDHINKWNWRISKNEYFKSTDKVSSEYYKLLKQYDLFIDDTEYFEPIINYPDTQGRLWKNLERIKWHGAVHEVLKGFVKVGTLPIHIIHIKNIKKQELQNEHYSKI